MGWSCPPFSKDGADDTSEYTDYAPPPGTQERKPQLNIRRCVLRISGTIRYVGPGPRCSEKQGSECADQCAEDAEYNRIAQAPHRRSEF